MNTPADLERRFAQVDPNAIAEAALLRQSEALADRVRELLSVPAGGRHTYPWLQSGSLRDSIAHEADPSGASVGSSDPVAAYQEFGTSTVPPRPFLAPAAASHGADIANAIATSMSDAIKEALGQ